MIEAKEIWKLYGTREVLRGTSFKLYNGKIYGILGRVGSGKSTLMRVLAGCEELTSGTVRINGFDVSRQACKAKKCIGFAPSTDALYDELTPFEYLRFVAESKGVAYEKARRQIHEVLELFEIEEDRNRPVRNLPMQTRRRVSLAQALLGNPDILLLDDPTQGLEKKDAEAILSMIRKLGEIKTVILTSRSLANLRAICDSILLLCDGAVEEPIPADDTEALCQLEARYATLRDGEKADVSVKKITVERGVEYELIDEKKTED